MSKLFDDLKESIADMTKHARGEQLEGITLNSVTIKPVPSASAKDIRKIRAQLGMSQGAFAAILGVSKKAVEAWEANVNVPTKPVIRLLQLLSSNRNLIDHLIESDATVAKSKKRRSVG